MKHSHFVDFVRVHVKAGNGGDGAVAFRREKYVPEGGPAGGHGGTGGSIYFEGDASMVTLLDFKMRSLIQARPGDKGANFNKAGHSGEDIVLRVPLGTCVIDADSGAELGDVTRAGQRVLVARGGRGGRGNESFATSTNRTPREFEFGEPGEERNLILELKAIADIGVVGLPNAGKSTLLAAVTSAHPKIAAYPFTTIHPNLGVMVDESLAHPVTIADIPGLIEGAHTGAGLGDRFLRHIERTRLIVHLVSPPDGVGEPEDVPARKRLIEDLVYSYALVREELAQYSEALGQKPTVVCLNKADLLSQETLKSVKRAFQRRGIPLLVISAQAGTNIEKLRELIYDKLSAINVTNAEGSVPPVAANPPEGSELRDSLDHKDG